MRLKTRKLGRFGGVGGAVVALVAVGVMTGAQSASAGNGKGFPRAYHAETAAGYTNTITLPTAVLKPKCPEAIMSTPGSFPATKTLNGNGTDGGLNTPSSFYVGGTVHYVYHDNPHGTRFNFTIQDCEVAYPSNFFTVSDFDPATGVLTNPAFTKQMLSKDGTPVDGAALSGISNPKALIYFSWTVQPEPVGTWMCNFARDIGANHGGKGNRKAIPTCFQVTSPPITFLGYTDSFRTTPGPTTPTLWAGANNSHGVPVTFVGCALPLEPKACGDAGFDGGAIRFDNPSLTETMTVQISNSSVVIGPCDYTPWSGLPNQVVPAGGTLILSETGGTPLPGCGDVGAAANDNFDTSEANEAISSKPCVADSAVPVIHMTIGNGAGSLTPYTFLDTNQILNTHGIDPGTCNGANETEDWSPLG